MWLDFRQVQYFYVDNPFGRSWKIQPSFSLPKVANVNVSVKKKANSRHLHHNVSCGFKKYLNSQNVHKYLTKETAITYSGINCMKMCGRFVRAFPLIALDEELEIWRPLFLLVVLKQPKTGSFHLWEGWLVQTNDSSLDKTYKFSAKTLYIKDRHISPRSSDVFKGRRNQ